ncbi:Uma2 family endonuclease [Nonomuraea sp. NPDC046802]|uniref:Uma2 family endonuclease n=1 Tax=Nonomuraea sp. NPDC046802 TaxID=3154919 RepID=UPI0033D0CA05
MIISVHGPTVLPRRPPYVVADWLTFPDDGNRYELFNGSVLISPLPTVAHQSALGQAMYLLHKAAPADLEPLMTVNVRASDEDCFIPDLVVAETEAVDSGELMLDPRDLHLIGEVVSPETRGRDRALKVLAYAAAGIPLYWRIEPDEGPTLYVYELDGDSYKPPIAYKAGTTVTLSAPYPMSFDPADLVDD